MNRKKDVIKKVQKENHNKTKKYNKKNERAKKVLTSRKRKMA